MSAHSCRSLPRSRSRSRSRSPSRLKVAANGRERGYPDMAELSKEQACDLAVKSVRESNKDNMQRAIDRIIEIDKAKDEGKIYANDLFRKLLDTAMEIKGENAIKMIHDIIWTMHNDELHYGLDMFFWEGRQWHDLAKFAISRLNISVLSMLRDDEHVWEYPLGDSMLDDWDLFLLRELKKRKENAKENKEAVIEYCKKVEEQVIWHHETAQLIWCAVYIGDQELLDRLIANPETLEQMAQGKFQTGIDFDTSLALKGKWANKLFTEMWNNHPIELRDKLKAQMAARAAEKKAKKDEGEDVSDSESEVENESDDDE